MPRQTLGQWLRRHHPDLDDPDAVIAGGLVRVDRIVRTNPAFPLRPGASVSVEGAARLRGEAKLRPAIEHFAVPIAGRVALDVGAAAGGFTKVLLECGARRVYAVDAGHGQLLGSLRQDPRVTNMEATNIGALNRSLVRDRIDVFTVDVSYLSLSSAVAQLDVLDVASDADLIGLVKPMFELRLGAPPENPVQLALALERAVAGVQAAGWHVVATMDSPVLGARGAREMLVHATRRSSPP